MKCPNCKERMNKNGIQGSSQSYKCKHCLTSIQIPIEATMTGYDVIEPSQVLTVKYDDTVRIHGLSDIHYGATEHDGELLDRAIQMIKDDPQARWFGNGDLMELIPSHYKISQRGQDTDNEEQVIGISEKLQQISEKCLFIRPGNHERRALNLMDMDITMIIASRLGVPVFREPGYTVIQINDKVWKLASGHGFSSAKNGNLELFKMKEVYPEADVFYLGHDHKLYAEPHPSMGVDAGGETLLNRWFIRGGSFLRYADYARERFYPMQKIGWVSMQFSETAIECVVH